MRVRWPKRTLSLSVCAAAVLAVGCSDGTAPSTVDPATMAGVVNGFSTSFSQNAVFQSLSALDGHVALSLAAARAALPSAGTPGVSWLTSSLHARAALSELDAHWPSAVTALFPANVLGKTFQWDTTSPAGYRITDSSLAGAPSAGVRFTLYQVDSGTGTPRLPLTTTGYLDLTDASTPQANVLHLLLKVATVTAADYSISEVRTTSSVSLSATGSVANVVSGGSIVDFDLSHVLSLADSSLSTNYQASGSGATVSLVSSLSGSGGSPAFAIDWTVRKGGSLEVVGTTTDSLIDSVQFKVNGAAFATVTGPVANPVITGVNGQQPTLADLVAMQTILVGFSAIYNSLSLVFVPGFVVFG